VALFATILSALRACPTLSRKNNSVGLAGGLSPFFAFPSLISFLGIGRMPYFYKHVAPLELFQNITSLIKIEGGYSGAFCYHTIGAMRLSPLTFFRLCLCLRLFLL
jgi:hypothetical protein